ncbi:MAG: hypothetical protein ROO73_04785 [Roseivirga sp.]
MLKIKNILSDRKSCSLGVIGSITRLLLIALFLLQLSACGNDKSKKQGGDKGATKARSTYSPSSESRGQVRGGKVSLPRTSSSGEREYTPSDGLASETAPFKPSPKENEFWENYENTLARGVQREEYYKQKLKAIQESIEDEKKKQEAERRDLRIKTALALLERNISQQEIMSVIPELTEEEFAEAQRQNNRL